MVLAVVLNKLSTNQKTLLNTINSNKGLVA